MLVLKNLVIFVASVLLAYFSYLLGALPNPSEAPAPTIFFTPLLRVVTIGIILLAVFSAQAIFVLRRNLKRREVLNLLLPPLLFLLGMISLGFLSESAWMRLLYALAIGSANALYFTFLFFYLFVPSRYEVRALQSASEYLNLTALFGISAGLYGLKIFVDTPAWLLLVLFVPLAWAVVTEALWVSKIPGRRALPLGALGALVLTEIFGAALFLPTSMYVNAAFVVLSAFVLVRSLDATAHEPEKLKSARRVTGFACLLALLLALTTPWR